MAKFRSIFTAHRLITLSTDLTALASAVSGLVGVMPAGWQNTALIGVGVLAKAATTMKFLNGNSHWETSPAGQAILTGSLGKPATSVRLKDIEHMIGNAVEAAAPKLAAAAATPVNAVPFDHEAEGAFDPPPGDPAPPSDWQPAAEPAPAAAAAPVPGPAAPADTGAAPVQ